MIIKINNVGALFELSCFALCTAFDLLPKQPAFSSDSNKKFKNYQLDSCFNSIQIIQIFKLNYFIETIRRKNDVNKLTHHKGLPCVS